MSPFEGFLSRVDSLSIELLRHGGDTLILDIADNFADPADSG
jgi:hypothetical protein